MNRSFYFALLVVISFPIYSQTTYRIDTDKAEKEILRGHLDLGGSNPAGVAFRSTAIS